MDDADKIKGLAGNLKAEGFGMSGSSNGTITLDGSTKPAPSAEAAPEPHTLSVQIAGMSRHFNEHGRHVKGYNETNLGAGVGIDINKDTTAFVTAYNNSYNDFTVVSGVNYAPLHAQAGDIKASLGVTASLAYTEHSSYVKAAPEMSEKHLHTTAIAGLYGSMEHVPSGVSVEANIVPPLGKDSAGVATISVRKRF